MEILLNLAKISVKLKLMICDVGYVVSYKNDVELCIVDECITEFVFMIY